MKKYEEYERVSILYTLFFDYFYSKGYDQIEVNMTTFIADIDVLKTPETTAYSFKGELFLSVNNCKLSGKMEIIRHWEVENEKD